jgi:hypothetical protein
MANFTIQHSDISFDVVNDSTESLLTAGRALVQLQQDVVEAQADLAMALVEKHHFITGLLMLLETSK